MGKEEMGVAGEECGKWEADGARHLRRSARRRSVLEGNISKEPETRVLGEFVEFVGAILY